MPVLLILLLLPLVEIALFIVIGGWLGLWATLALVILGVLAGVLILRGQQERALRMMQGGVRAVSPGTFMAQGAFRMLAGMLLILPGFFSDFLALLLLLPPVQRAILRALSAKMTVTSVHARRESTIIDGEYEVYEPRAETPPISRIEGPHRH